MAALYTLGQYQALLRARSSGVSSITIEGRTTSWRSLDELDRILASIRADLEANGLLTPATQPIRRVRLVATKGF